MYCAASTVHDFVELLEVALSNIICRGKKKEEMARLLFATACLCHMITGTLVHFGESFLSLVTFSHVISKLVVRVMMCCSSVVCCVLWIYPPSLPPFPPFPSAKSPTMHVTSRMFGQRRNRDQRCPNWRNISPWPHRYSASIHPYTHKLPVHTGTHVPTHPHTYTPALRHTSITTLCMAHCAQTA